MRICSVWKPATITLSALLALGCETVSTTQEPKFYPKPTFDQSHAILIENTVKGMPIVSAIKDFVRKNEKIIVISIEGNTSGDTAVNYLIDDNFIRNLISDGYRVLERDDTMMGRMVPEQAGTYKRSLLDTLPVPPSVAVLDALESNGVSSMKSLSSTDLAALYKQIRDDYAAYEAQQMHMETADVILSYRLLECGIIYDIEKKKAGKIDAATGKEDPNSPKLWTYDIKRDAMARLFIRVMDAKSGEVRTARVLQNEKSDKVTFQQDKDESDGDYFARINDYIALLSKYHYTYYDQQLPNQRGTGELLMTVTDTTKKQAPTTEGQPVKE